MRFSFWPAPTQPWNELLETVRHVEATGWDGIWYADSFMPSPRQDGGYLRSHRSRLQPRTAERAVPVLDGFIDEVAPVAR